jgi:hypothetical protein
MYSIYLSFYLPIYLSIYLISFFTRLKDKIFLAGALGNYSLAGFEMVSK